MLDNRSYTLEETLAEASRDCRTCPNAEGWMRLWNLLPNREQVQLPLILGGWSAPAATKYLLFHRHIRWAFEHGAGDAAGQLIFNLKPREWFHGFRGLRYHGEE